MIKHPISTASSEKYFLQVRSSKSSSSGKTKIPKERKDTCRLDDTCHQCSPEQGLPITWLLTRGHTGLPTSKAIQPSFWALFTHTVCCSSSFVGPRDAKQQAPIHQPSLKYFSIYSARPQAPLHRCPPQPLKLPALSYAWSHLLIWNSKQLPPQSVLCSRRDCLTKEK